MNEGPTTRNPSANRPRANDSGQFLSSTLNTGQRGFKRRMNASAERKEAGFHRVVNFGKGDFNQSKGIMREFNTEIILRV